MDDTRPANVAASTDEASRDAATDDAASSDAVQSHAVASDTVPSHAGPNTPSDEGATDDVGSSDAAFHDAAARGDALGDAADATPAPATIADGRDRQLDPRAIRLGRLVGWIVTAVMAAGSLVGVLIVWAANGFSAPAFVILATLWLVAIGALAWHAQRWPAIEYRHTSYRADADGIEIRRGVYWRVVINVPRSRVQHTDVSQGPLERRFGLGTLVIYTAGTDHAKVDLGGLDHALALRIREHLLPGERADAL